VGALSAGESLMTQTKPLSLLKLVKRQTLQAARKGGLLSIARESSWRGRRLLILGYHGVSTDDEHEWDGELYIPPSLLRRRFTALRDGGYAVLPLGEAVQRMYAGSLPARAVVLTFDDGAYDFLSQACPLLEEFGFPATVYLTSYYSVVQRPVFNTMLRYMLWKARGQRLDASDITIAGGSLTLTTAAERDFAFSEIAQANVSKGLSGEEKDRVLSVVAERLSLDYGKWLERRFLHLMSPADVARLPRSVSVELHTHRHRVPTESEAFAREIDENRQAILSMTGEPPATHFCYPSGVTHPSFPGWLRELGVVSATTCFPGIASPSSDPLYLPRLIDTVNVTDVEFESWLTGASAFLPRRRVRAIAPI
jgi:peptidoglycan/xylan/chitin deacetylase (PgdA/CDA1 family)